MASGSQHRCVFVGNIPYDATEEQLVQICEEVGPVVSFRLVLDRETQKPKGYGFCEYKDEETALSARRNLHGYEINGRQLRVDFAENDKDRNREEGRGGPGLIPNIDAQKISSGPPLLGNSYIQQPVGLALAVNAASVMAGGLGGIQLPSGFGGDLLSLYLAKMSRNQLYEIMREMKALVSQDKTLALRVLQMCPQLSKALFQSQIMLGMVPQQIQLQMANNHQSGSVGMKPQISSDGQTTSLPHTAQLPALQSTAQIGIYSQPQDGRMSVSSQNLLVRQSHIQPDYQSLSSSIQPPILPTVTGILPVQPPLMQQPNQQDSVSASANTSTQQPALAQPLPPQASRPPGLPSSALPYLEQALKNNDAHEPTIPPAKLARREDGSRAPQIISSSSYATTTVPAQGSVPGSGFTSQAANIDSQKSEKQTPQFLPEAEAALLQQVMNLTAEQLNSLPPEQRQQVVQLQQMLRS